MKILMLGWELPPYNSGGLGVACFQLCKALAAKGCDIDFVVPYTAKHDIGFMNVIAALPYSQAQLHEFGGAYDSHKYLATTQHESHLPRSLRELQAAYGRSVQQLASRGGYDIVHAHDWLTFEAAMAAQREATIPIIAHVHATEFDRSGEFYGNPLVHEVERLGLIAADHIVAVSEQTKRQIVREYGIPASKIEVIHNSVDPADLQFEPVVAANSYAYLRRMKERGYKVVVSTNRFTAQKGMTYFLRAAQLAVQKNPKLLFLLGGSGDQYEELVRMSAELGISQNVLFPGFIRGKAWRDAYSIADLFVMSSVSEPFGISALEGVGYGLVTIVTNQSGVREVVKNMLTYDYWDIQKLAGYIVAASRHDGLVQTIRQNGLEEFKHLSWHKVAEKCQNLYNTKLRQVVA